MKIFNFESNFSANKRNRDSKSTRRSFDFCLNFKKCNGYDKMILKIVKTIKLTNIVDADCFCSISTIHFAINIIIKINGI